MGFLNSKWGLVCGILGMNIGRGSQQRMEEPCMALVAVGQEGAALSSRRRVKSWDERLEWMMPTNTLK